METRHPSLFPGRLDKIRRSVGSFLVDNTFRSLGYSTRYLPMAYPRFHGVEVIRHVPYRAGGDSAHLLDIYRPLGMSGPLPVVLYIHGGGFRILSKESHWLMALIFARSGYLVFNINYRLAPRCPYPAAHVDAADAYQFVVENAARYGGDIGRLVLAGESAGANLVTSLTLATCYRLAEPCASNLFDLGVVPAAVAPACGILEVSNCVRYEGRRGVGRFLVDRIMEVEEAYLRHSSYGQDDHDFANPLRILERGETPLRALPPFFVPCGSWDPLLDDSRRLSRVLSQMGVRCEAKVYPRGIHAFHALIWQGIARQCWRDQLQFLREVLTPSAERITLTGAPLG